MSGKLRINSLSHTVTIITYKVLCVPKPTLLTVTLKWNNYCWVRLAIDRSII